MSPLLSKVYGRSVTDFIERISELGCEEQGGLRKGRYVDEIFAL